MSRFDSANRLLDFLRINPEIIVITLLVIIYLFLGNYFAYSVTFTNGTLNVSGGSDPYYNFRVIQYMLTTGHWMTHDAALNYPLGATNPRPPFFHVLIVLVAVILSPFMNPLSGATYAFLEFDAVFGALLIIPVYLLGKEVFGTKVGLLTAILYTLMPSNLSSGILSDGRMHTPELFFAFLTIYFFLKAINTTQKKKIILKKFAFRMYPSYVMNYFYQNRSSTVYSLLAGASFGALMLSWQGYAYILAIIVIYAFVQFIVNIFTKKSTQYVTYHYIAFAGMGFLLGSYYYVGLGNASAWLYPAIYLALGIVAFGILMAFAEDFPWIISIPSLAVLVLILVGGLKLLDPGLLNSIISGEGYFIKTRVYATIAEAASPPLGQYISGFGPAQFLLGLSGLAYVIYLYFKEKKDGILFILLFSLVSIYMSFAAARFNVTAAPAYAVLGAALLGYFGRLLKISEIKNRKHIPTSGIKGAIKGSAKGVQALLVAIVVVLLIIPSAFTTIAAAVPNNNANSVNDQIYNSLPSFLRPYNYSSSSGQFVGSYGFGISNASQPSAAAFSWLSTQDTNLPIDQRPAFVSWWDYGFQEISQGQHPTVADDFQQGYEVAGQVLLAQNQSQIISLFMARVIQGAYVNNGGQLPASVNATMYQYFGPHYAALLLAILKNPSSYQYMIFSNPGVFGTFIKGITPTNAYFALYSGILSSNFPISTLVNAYLQFGIETGYSIKYIGIDHALFPSSGDNPGIFYAPTYLTDKPSYTANGEVVPYQYYQIFAQTANGTFPLNQTPSAAQPLGYTIQYNPAFYNTTIYRMMVGYPPQATGNTSGIPGLTFGASKYTIMPAWNLSHFELSYIGVPWNPHHNYTKYPNAWKVISLQQAYYYQKNNIGTTEIFPPTSQVVNGEDTIISYYPGATITGRVTQGPNNPAPGLYVTLLDQYGIPHDFTTTNAQGYYNLTAVPGNDTILISHGAFNKIFLSGSTSIQYLKVKVSNQQAERIATSYNSTTGLPSYYIVQNYVLKPDLLKGTLSYQYQLSKVPNAKGAVPVFDKRIENAQIFFTNSSTGLNISAQLVNGVYQLSNVPPTVFNASVLVNGTYYKDISTVDMSTGGAITQDLNIEFDSLYMNVSYNGNRLQGYKITASGHGQVFSNLTNFNGSSSIWVTPGKYTVQGIGSNTSTQFITVDFPTWNLNNSLNLTPEMSVKLTGHVLGVNAPGTLYLYSNGNVNYQLTAAISPSGNFNTVVPVGVYTIYFSQGDMAYASTIQLTNDTTLSITPSPSYNLSISGAISTNITFSGTYEIISSNTLLSYGFGTNGTWNISLPSGTYYISASGISVGKLYYNFTQLTLVSERTLKLLMGVQEATTVGLYNPNVYQGLNSKSAVVGAIVEASSYSIPLYYSVTNVNGTATLFYPDFANGSTSATTISTAYDKTTVGVQYSSLSSFVQDIPVQPKVKNVTFNLESNGNAIPLNGELELSGSIHYNLTISSGVARGSIMPGSYWVNITSPSAKVKPTYSILTIPTASNGTAYLNVITYSSINVIGSLNSKLFYTNGTMVQNYNSVPTGNYYLYASGSGGSNLTEIYIFENASFTVNFQTSYFVKFSNSLGLSEGTYRLTSGSISINLTQGSYNLPVGSYAVVYNYLLSNSSGTFVASGSQHFNISSSSLSVKVSSTLTNVYVELYGSTSFLNSPQGFTKVEVIGQTGNVLNYSNSNSAGNYTVYVSPGNNILYAFNNLTGVGDFVNVSVPVTGKYNYNVQLVRAYTVDLSVVKNMTILNTDVIISTNTTKYQFNTTQSSLLLPSGTYNFTSSVKSSMPYPGGNKTAYYNSTYYTYVGKNGSIVISLTLSNQYNLNFKQLSKVATANVTSQVNYTFNVTNRGLSPVNLTFGTANSSWAMSFDPGSVYIQPGVWKNVNVTLNVPHGAQSGLNAVPFFMNYSQGSVKEVLNITVNPFYSASLTSINTYGVPTNESILVPFTIKNSGNSLVNVSLFANTSVVDNESWSFSFYYLGSKVTNVSVNGNSSLDLYLQMYPNTSKPQNIPSIAISGYYKGGWIHLTLTPSYAPPPVIKPYPGGSSVLANYTGNPYDSLIIGVVIIAAAVIAGLIAASIRGRRNR